MTEYGVDFSISHFWSTHLVGGCSFDMSNITCFSYFFKKKIFSITIPYSWKNHGNIHLAHFYYIQETLYLSAFQAFLFVKTFHRRECKYIWYAFLQIPTNALNTLLYDTATFHICAKFSITPLPIGTKLVQEWYNPKLRHPLHLMQVKHPISEIFQNQYNRLSDYTSTGSFFSIMISLSKDIYWPSSFCSSIRNRLNQIGKKF